MSDSLDALIAQLETLCTKLETAPSTQLEPVLSAATAVTSSVIHKSLPLDQRQSWLSELDDVVGEKKTPTDEAQKEETVDAHECSQKIVPCIHACGVQFCCATKRRREIKQHAKTCEGIRKRLMLKRAAISTTPDLF